jgi:excisionase family DNA binding protein
MANDGALLLTVEQAAELLQISKGLAYDLCREGKLPHVRLGRVIRVPRFALEQWIAREASVTIDNATLTPLLLPHNSPQSH